MTTNNGEFLLVLAITTLCLTGPSIQQADRLEIETQPQNTTAKIGDSVVLTCVFKSAVHCSWLRKGVQTSIGGTRYSYADGGQPPPKTDCSIRISPMAPLDFTSWQCSNVITEEVQTSVQSFAVWISEQKAPTPPKILLNGMEATELKLPIRDTSQPPNLTCISENGNPAATLTWRLGESRYPGITDANLTGENQYTATIKWNESDDWTLFDSYTELTCLASHPSFHSEQQARLRFARDYATRKVLVDAEGRMGEEFDLPANEQINFICKADGEPQPTFIWESSEGDNQWLQIAKTASITVYAEDKQYRCRAKNSLNAEAVTSRIFIVRRREVEASDFGVIIAVVIAVIIFLALVLLGVIFLYRRKKWIFAPKAASVPTTLDAEAADQDNEKSNEKTPFSDSQAEPQYENLKQNGKEEEINGKTDHSPMKESMEKDNSPDSKMETPH